MNPLNTGMFGAYSPSSGINPAQHNPNGYTGVTDNNSGVGFHGSTAHLNTVGLPQMNQQSTFDPTRGPYQAVTFSQDTPENRAAWLAAEKKAAQYQKANGHPVTAHGGQVDESYQQSTQQAPQEIIEEFFYGQGTPNATQEETPYSQGGGTYSPPIEGDGSSGGDDDGLGFGHGPGVPEPSNPGPNPSNPGPNPSNPGPNPSNPGPNPIDWNGGEEVDFSSNYDPRGKSTPFLDAYIRSQQAAKQEGPVTGMMSKYME